MFGRVVSRITLGAFFVGCASRNTSRDAAEMPAPLPRSPEVKQSELVLSGAASDRFVLVKVIGPIRGSFEWRSLALSVGGGAPHFAADAPVPFACGPERLPPCYAKFEVSLGDAWDGAHPVVVTYRDGRGATATEQLVLNPVYNAGSCDYDGHVCTDSFIDVIDKDVRLSCNGKFSRKACSNRGRAGRCTLEGEREGDAYVMSYYTPAEGAESECRRLRGRWYPG